MAELKMRLQGKDRDEKINRLALAVEEIPFTEITKILIYDDWAIAHIKTWSKFITAKLLKRKLRKV